MGIRSVAINLGISTSQNLSYFALFGRARSWASSSSG
jgi:hypothetical protein